MPCAVATTKYLSTLAGIGRAYEGARKTIVIAYWTIGRHIVELEQDGNIHAQYGAGLLQKLSHDLSTKYGSGFSVTNLERMRLFYVENPKSAHVPKLPWGHQIALLPVTDLKKRKALANRAEKEGLNRPALRELVKNEVAAETVVKPLAALKRPKGLELSTYKKAGDFIDCGFFVFYPLSKEDAKGVAFRDAPSYTYAATVERVIDGDTLSVQIEVGFGIVVMEKLRLRGINCPELGTPEGEKAKRFVVGRLAPKTRIVIRSAKGDKYGRFVADIFYLSHPRGGGGFEEIISGGTYLNQELLDKGFAVRME